MKNSNKKPISTIIDPKVKSALNNLAKKDGRKICYHVEQAIIQYLRKEKDEDDY